MVRWVLFGALLAAASPAFADASPEDDAVVARQLFEEGARQYDEGALDKALVHFTAARKVKPSPALDYNIARCEDELGHPDKAIQAYHYFLASNPPRNNDGGARVRVAELEAQQAPAITQPPPPRRDRRRLSIGVSGAVGGLALAAVATGLGLYIDSGTRFDELRTGGCGLTANCGPDRWGGTRIEERAGVGLLAVGGVLVAVDAALWFGWTRREMRARAPRVPLYEGGSALAQGSGRVWR